MNNMEEFVPIGVSHHISQQMHHDMQQHAIPLSKPCWGGAAHQLVLTTSTPTLCFDMAAQEEDWEIVWCYDGWHAYFDR